MSDGWCCPALMTSGDLFAAQKANLDKWNAVLK